MCTLSDALVYIYVRPGYPNRLMLNSLRANPEHRVDRTASVDVQAGSRLGVGNTRRGAAAVTRREELHIVLMRAVTIKLNRVASAHLGTTSLLGRSLVIVASIAITVGAAVANDASSRGGSGEGESKTELHFDGACRAVSFVFLCKRLSL